MYDSIKFNIWKCPEKIPAVIWELMVAAECRRSFRLSEAEYSVLADTIELLNNKQIKICFNEIYKFISDKMAVIPTQSEDGKMVLNACSSLLNKFSMFSKDDNPYYEMYGLADAPAMGEIELSALNRLIYMTDDMRLGKLLNRIIFSYENSKGSKVIGTSK